MVATDEVEASILTAEEHLEDAKRALRDSRYHDCAYHSASAAENAGNALLLAMGGRVPRAHRDAEAINFVAKRLRPSWLKDEIFRKMVDALRDLEDHVVKSRYPIKVRMGVFMPPDKYYTKRMVAEMLKKGLLVVETVKSLLVLLGR